MDKRELIQMVNKNGLSLTEQTLFKAGYSYEEIRKMFDSVKEHYSHSDNDWIYCAGHLKCYESEKQRYGKEIDKRIKERKHG